MVGYVGLRRVEVANLITLAEGLRYGVAEREDFKPIQDRMLPGTTLTYRVLREEKEIDVPVVLGDMPERIRWQILGMHMMQHASAEPAADRSS